MLVPWVTSVNELREMFDRTSDVVVMPAFDLILLSEEGEEAEPVDGCRVVVRTKRACRILCDRTGWTPDEVTNRDIGYTPVATFTLPWEQEEVTEELECALADVPIRRKIFGRWIWFNSYEPPAR